MRNTDDAKVFNFMCNTTKKNYVKLVGHYTVEEIDHIHEFMVKFGICSSADRIVHSVRQKESGIGSSYHDISFIKSFYDIFNDPNRMSKVAVKLIGKAPKEPVKKQRKKKKTIKSPEVRDNFSITDFMDKNRNHPRIPLSDKSDDEVSYISASKEEPIENFNDSHSPESDESTEHFDIEQSSPSESASEGSIEISAESEESIEISEESIKISEESIEMSAESEESDESESTESESDESESTESDESSTSSEASPVKKAPAKKKVDEIMKRLPKQKEEPKKKVAKATKNIRTPKQMKKVINKKPDRPKEFREPIPPKKKK